MLDRQERRSKGPISLQEFKREEKLADLAPQRGFIAIEPLENAAVHAIKREKACCHLRVDRNLRVFGVAVALRAKR
jgi:hypothetical protein